MKLDELLERAGQSITVRRVFADPYETDGGFGVKARPAGAFVIRGGEVSWRPAVDLNRLVAVLGAVTIAWLVTRARIWGSHRRG
jgi:hypothetical protein